MSDVSEPPKGILFPETVSLQEADKGLFNMIKSLCDKFFHNFWWEVSQFHRWTYNERR